MFRKILTTAMIVGLLVGTTVTAADVSLGVKGGLNLSHFYGEEEETVGATTYKPYEDQKMKLGMVIGAFLALQLADMFALQPEVLFSMKG